MAFSESNRGTDADLELIHEPAAQRDNAASGADDPLQVSVHNGRQVFDLKPEAPIPGRENFEAASDAEGEPGGA